jgi:XTP/dITP diphosphohydrolase
VPEVVEDAPDFVGNARLKAHALRDATGEWALADDSGLEVDALDGAPGVHSARFAGEPSDDAANVALLLQRLHSVGAVSPSQRSARFRCVIVLAAPDGRELVAEGVVEGRIIDRPTGDGGFGYDPVFVPTEGDGRTFALMSPSEKHAVSHRGRALRALADRLR